jgi:hypothetical protein
MLKNVKLKILLGLVLAVSVYLTSCSPTPQKDCGFVQNIYGQRIAWKLRQPVKVYVDVSVPKELRPALYRAAKTWEDQAGRNLFEFIEDSTELNKAPSRDSKNAIYFLSNWESDRSSEQGRTSVYWAGDQIQEADIRVNGADFGYYDQDTLSLVGSANLRQQGVTPRNGYSFEALLLHELGHFLGLKHRDSGSTVMATHLAAYTNRTQLSQTDQESIRCEYN